MRSAAHRGRGTLGRPSVISMARSIGTSRNVWRVPLVGQETSRARIASARPRPTVQARVAAEARPGRDGPVARHDRAVGAGQVDPDLGSEGRPVGPGAHQLDRQPVVAVSRVLEQDVVGPVARGRAAGLEEDVGVAVAVPVGEGHAMPLLEVAGPRRGGDVLEPPAAVVSEQHVGHQVRVRRPAGPEVDVQESVIVQVAEVRAHRQDDPVQPELGRHVAERFGRADVAIQTRPLAGRRPAELVAR